MKIQNPKKKISCDLRKYYFLLLEKLFSVQPKIEKNEADHWKERTRFSQKQKENVLVMQVVEYLLTDYCIFSVIL